MATIVMELEGKALEVLQHFSSLAGETPDQFAWNSIFLRAREMSQGQVTQEEPTNISSFQQFKARKEGKLSGFIPAKA